MFFAKIVNNEYSRTKPASILYYDLLHCIALSYGIHHILALDDLAEDRVHTIKMGLGRMGDEELGAI
jgi:hypothetical protein